MGIEAIMPVAGEFFQAGTTSVQELESMVYGPPIAESSEGVDLVKPYVHVIEEAASRVLHGWQEVDDYYGNERMQKFVALETVCGPFTFFQLATAKKVDQMEHAKNTTRGYEHSNSHMINTLPNVTRGIISELEIDVAYATKPRLSQTVDSNDEHAQRRLYKPEYIAELAIRNPQAAINDLTTAYENGYRAVVAYEPTYAFMQALGNYLPNWHQQSAGLAELRSDALEAQEFIFRESTREAQHSPFLSRQQVWLCEKALRLCIEAQLQSED